MRAFGLIGRRLGHSRSATYFEEKFRKEGITDCSYELFELPDIRSLRTLLEARPELEGFNVTIPYKQQIIPLLDDLSDEARCIGAVNCVRRRNGRLEGFNTDASGFADALDALLAGDSPEQALVLGTGGASLAVQYVLARREIPYAIVSRDPARGNYTYDTLPCETLAGSRLIVNATPVGTYPACDEAPRLPYAFVGSGHYLFDLVYNPPLTQFLDYGVQRGARTGNGLEMHRLQAEASWRIWNDL